MQQITVNVTNLVQTAKEKHLLFYPLIMHILLSELKTTNKAVICEQPGGTFIQTHFHSDFFVFYKNYVNDCFFKSAATDLSGKEIVSFALSEQSFPKADFILSTFDERDFQTFLTVSVNTEVPADFGARCQEAILSF